MKNKRALLVALVGALLVLAGVVAFAEPEGIIDSEASPTSSHARLDPAGPGIRADVSVSAAPERGVHPIRSGFVGISVEFNALRRYTGMNPHAINPVFEQLLRNLAPGQRPILRIGGDSTDWTWWPVAGIASSPGLAFRLNRAWLARTRALLADLHARAIVGVNLEARNPKLAAEEARALIRGLGRRRVQAVEIGNEPTNYARYAWYRVHRRAIYGRGPGYSFNRFLAEFDAVRRDLHAVPLAGPALGGGGWMEHLPAFLAAEPGVSTVTLHRYPLHGCFAAPGTPAVATLSNLLAPTASRDFVAPLRPVSRLAHAHHATLRLDELNSVSCGGQPGLSDTFASALWAVDALFEAVKAGVDGVNIHTFPRAAYRLFDFSLRGGHWTATVKPEYYGLLIFARAAPSGARLLRTGSTASHILRSWATRSRAGTVRVVVINKSLTLHVRALIHVHGGHGVAQLERLSASSVLARHGVTLGGQRFAPHSATGLLSGPLHARTVRLRSGACEVILPPASAALLTITPG